MFPRKCCQEWWKKSPKLVGQMLELVGHLSHQLNVSPVIQLKYALLKGHDQRKRHPIFIIYYEIMQ